MDEKQIAKIIDETKEIISTPTENPPGENYLFCASTIGEIMKKIGYTVDYIHVPSYRLKQLSPQGW